MKFQYNDKHVFVDWKSIRQCQVWELLSKCKPDRNFASVQDKESYKQILLQSNAHGVNYSTSGKIKANEGLKFMRFFRNLSLTQKNYLGNRYSNVLGKVYYDPQHSAA